MIVTFCSKSFKAKIYFEKKKIRPHSETLVLPLLLADGDKIGKVDLQFELSISSTE